MRRATTWAERRSVSVKTAKIELSASRQAKSTWRIEPGDEPRRVEAELRSVAALERKPRDRKADAALFRFADGAVEIAPERVVGEKPGFGIDHALGVERFEHAAQPFAERVHAHIRQKAFDQPLPVPRRCVRDSANARQFGSTTPGWPAKHGDRQIAKAHILGQDGQQRVDDARAKTFADHHAVDVAGLERARRALDAERADNADPFADATDSVG